MIQVKWDETACIHSANCVKKLPNVFRVENGQFVRRERSVGRDDQGCRRGMPLWCIKARQDMTPSRICGGFTAPPRNDRAGDARRNRQHWLQGGITSPLGDTACNLAKAGVQVQTEGLAHAPRNIKGCQVGAHFLVPALDLYWHDCPRSLSDPGCPSKLLTFIVGNEGARPLHLLFRQ
jgi:hypothetical protein